MSEYDGQQFDDPGLKAALKRLYGQERAPDALRARVLARLSEAAAPSEVTPAPSEVTPAPAARPATASPAFWRRPRFAYAAVAAVLLVGAAGLVYRVYFTPPGGTVTVADATLAGMVKTHEACCHLESHQQYPQLGEDFPRLGGVMGKRLAHPVLAANLKGDGWTYRGAAICQVKGEPCAHLLFERDGRWVSVFSVKGLTKGDGPVAGATIDGHPIRGFVRDGVLCAIVGRTSQGTTEAELEQLLEKHKAEVFAPAATARRQTPPAAELLYAVNAN